MIFDIATFKIKILHRPTLLNFSESFYRNYKSFLSKNQEHVDFIITIVPFDSFSLSLKKFIRRQGYFYYEKKGLFILKNRGTIAWINTTTKKMNLGFKDTIQEGKKNTILLAFIRLAVSLCTVLEGGLPFHCSAIAFGDRGVAFSGPSRAGKSTIAELLATQGQLLNDDFNVILPHGKNAFKIYSTPFAHLEMLKKCVNRGADLRTIFFIEKSTANEIETLSFKNKYIFALAHSFIFPLSDFFGNKILDNAERLCKSVECKRLYFNNSGAIRPFMYHYTKGIV
jgi:hypothetical protein